MSRVETALTRLVTAFEKVGQYMFPLLMLLIVVDVIGRRLLSLPTVSFQEAEWHVHATLFLLTLGGTYLRNGHVRVEILSEKFSIKTRHVVEIIGAVILVLPYLGLILWFSTQFAWAAFLSGEGSSAAEGLGQRWIIKSVMPLGALVLAMATVVVVMRSARGLRGDVE